MGTPRAGEPAHCLAWLLFKDLARGCCDRNLLEKVVVVKELCLPQAFPVYSRRNLVFTPTLAEDRGLCFSREQMKPPGGSVGQLSRTSRLE